MDYLYEMTDFEKYILNKSGYSYHFDRGRTEFYEKKMKNILKKHYKGRMKVKEGGLYSIFNPLLESKPAHIIYIKEIFNDKVLILPESEIPQGISVYSKKLKMKLIFDSNLIELPLIALNNAEYIENLKIPDLNSAILLSEAYKKTDNEENYALISPFLHLKNLTDSMFLYKEIIWDIPIFVIKPVFSAKLNKINKNNLLGKISELQRFKEVQFNDGNIILLNYDDEKIKYEIIKGKFKINGKNSKDKGEIFNLSNDEAKTIKIESIKSGEIIDIKIRNSQ